MFRSYPFGLVCIQIFPKCSIFVVIMNSILSFTYLLKQKENLLELMLKTVAK